MPDGYRDIVLAAFESPEWRTSADAIYQATGVSINVMDFAAGELIASTGRCGFCHLATGAGAAGPESCFDIPPSADSSPCRVTCRAGLSSEIRPVFYEGDCVAHVVTSGFVISTRERKRLYELLLVRGVREEAARLALKAMPIISRRQAESWADMAAAAADSALAAERGRRLAAERGEDFSAVLAAGRRVLAATMGDAAALGQLVADAVQIAGAIHGSLYLPGRDGELRLVASTRQGGDQRARGGLALALKAFTTRRSVLVPEEGPGAGRALVALPITMGEKALGSLEFTMEADKLPLSKNRAGKLERYVRFVGLTLDRLAESQRAARESQVDSRLAELAVALGGQTDREAIARVVIRAIERGFAADLGGLLITAWGVCRADILLASEVSQVDLDTILCDAAGNAVGLAGFDDVNLRGAGRIADDAPDFSGCSTLAAEIQADEITVGTLFVAAEGAGRFDAEDRRLLEGIAAHSAGALQRAALFERIRDDYAKTIAALSASLGSPHSHSSADSTGVMEYAVLIGDELGLSSEDVESLRFAGLVHEIGTGLPHEVLLAPSRGAGSQVDRLGRHSQIGASVTRQIEFLKALTPVILHHHERWDGDGYPAGLSGEAIPVLARVLAVADAFAELTTSSPDRPRMTFAQARKDIEAAAGAQFDPDVVSALCEALDRQARAGSIGLFAENGEDQLPA